MADGNVFPDNSGAVSSHCNVNKKGDADILFVPVYVEQHESSDRIYADRSDGSCLFTGTQHLSGYSLGGWRFCFFSLLGEDSGGRGFGAAGTSEDAEGVPVSCKSADIAVYCYCFHGQWMGGSAGRRYR